ncbi:MAG TPA: flagellar hook assembly protein FlgD [Burkholderiaceae bacterium]|nr:flagellar hook assembly protein FlgD [Burkholderiaceae bacterium]
MTTSAVSGTDSASIYSQLSSGSNKTTAQESSDRFLKLLVTQMQNQDPLSPMDNAQVTSQMAQINTVSGIEKLNETISGMLGQFTQMQSLQSASLVGRNVLVQGDTLEVKDGKATAAFDLAGAADSVKVEVLSAGGRVIDTLDLGAESAGRHGFNWEAAGVDSGAGLHFRVTATHGAAAVTATPLVSDQVTSVSTKDGKLMLELSRGGSTAYSLIKAFS